MIRLRVATLSDFPGVLALLMEMADETAMALANWDKVGAKLSKLLSESNVIVADKDGRIVGSVGLEHTSWWYSDEGYLADRWTFVTKSERKGLTAARLIKFARNYANAQGLPLAMGVWTKDDTARKNSLFRRYLRPIGEMFMVEN